MLEVRLLGQFEVRLNGAELKIPSRSVQSLLAYLILHAGTAYRREYLAGLFWPDSVETNAKGYLRQALWQLRNAFAMGQAAAPDYFTADKITLAFNTQLPYWLDAAVLEDEQADGLEDLIKTPQVYKGELLPGFYDEWVVLERERLRGLFDRKMQRLLEALQSQRRWEELLMQAEAWIALGDIPEPAYRGLILAHAAQGDLSSALAAYRRCIRSMERGLGVLPSPETTWLAEQLQSGKSVVEAAPAWSISGLTTEKPVKQVNQGVFHNLPPPPGPFIGRETELSEIAVMLANPDCRLLTLFGPGGIGKSRLALKAGEKLLNSYRQGVCFVPLEGVGSYEFIPSTILTALDLDQLSQSEPKQQLFTYMRSREMLLVLDNFEHLLDRVKSTDRSPSTCAAR
jgi:DNA-binding SARP family transcriptional activator